MINKRTFFLILAILFKMIPKSTVFLYQIRSFFNDSDFICQSYGFWFISLRFSIFFSSGERNVSTRPTKRDDTQFFFTELSSLIPQLSIGIKLKLLRPSYSLKSSFFHLLSENHFNLLLLLQRQTFRKVNMDFNKQISLF